MITTAPPVTTTEELVARIQSGEDLLHELWEQVERFVAWYCNRLHILGVEFDDLYQCGYPALVRAVNAWDSAQAGTFNSYYLRCLQSEITLWTGWRTERQKRDPIHNAKSLDTPLADDPGFTLADTVPDPSDAYEEAEERVYTEQLHDALERCIERLPGDQGKIIRERHFEALTLKEIAKQRGVSPELIRQTEVAAMRGLRHPRCRRELAEFRWDIISRSYRQGGLAAWRDTGYSSVERAVEKLGRTPGYE